MSKFFQKIKALYDKIKTRKESYSRDSIKPVHDWNILLIVSFTLLLVLAITASYFYQQINQGKLFTTEVNDKQVEVAINNNLLKKIVDEIRERQSSMNSIKQNKGIPSDPSL